MGTGGHLLLLGPAEEEGEEEEGSMSEREDVEVGDAPPSSASRDFTLWKRREWRGRGRGERRGERREERGRGEREIK